MGRKTRYEGATHRYKTKYPKQLNSDSVVVSELLAIYIPNGFYSLKERVQTTSKTFIQFYFNRIVLFLSFGFSSQC